MSQRSSRAQSPAGQKARSRRKPSGRRPRNEVGDLPPRLRQLVERLLVEGATFEDTVEAVNERGKEGVTLQAVRDYFRSHLELQQRRIQRQMETAQALTKALRHPRSGQAKLAQAIMLTGLMGVSRREAAFGVKDAMSTKLQRENLGLRQQLLLLKVRKEIKDQKYAEARLRNELARWELTRGHIEVLKQQLAKTGEESKLGPETLQKIREIYGLIAEPVTPQEGPHAPAQA